MIYLLQGFKYSRDNLPSRFLTRDKMSFSEGRETNGKWSKEHGPIQTPSFLSCDVPSSRSSLVAKYGV